MASNKSRRLSDSERERGRKSIVNRSKMKIKYNFGRNGRMTRHFEDEKNDCSFQIPDILFFSRPFSTLAYDPTEAVIAFFSGVFD